MATDAPVLHIAATGGKGGAGGRGWEQCSPAAAHGGSGGKGGSADDINVTVTSGLTVVADGDADGLLLRSQVGNGGKGQADFPFTKSFGGPAGAGGNSGKITLDFTGALKITTESGYGLLAETLGGDGGNGGEAQSAAGVTTSGGQGGTGAAIVVDLGTNVRIETEGGEADGIFARSYGGAGGSGAAGTAVSTANPTQLTLNIGIGGRAGDGGSGGNVAVTRSGQNAGIKTKGTGAEGLVAPSLGSLNLSFGARGASGGGAGGAVTVRSTDTLSTLGDLSVGLMALSQGGGGGLRGVAVACSSINTAAIDFSLGGAGGGESGAVSVDHFGIVSTTGDLSAGISASSVAGSGDSGGLTFSGSLISAGSLSMGIGGGGGDGGTAGKVTLAAQSTVATIGDISSGLDAQSTGGAGGTGCDVTVTTTAENGEKIITTGLFADGVSALNQGGAGGQGGLAGSATFSTAVEVVEVPSIDLAFSIGGSAGDGGTGGAGRVAVNVNADVSATGTNARAILAQSDGNGNDTSGPIVITIDSGATVRSGANSYEAVAILDGRAGLDGSANLLRNSGTITKGGGASDGDVSGAVIAVQDNGVYIDNRGLISGAAQIDSAGATIRTEIVNQRGGVWEFGPASSFNNVSFVSALPDPSLGGGTITAGARDAIATARIRYEETSAGNYFEIQGILWVDYQFGDQAAAEPPADKLVFQGALQSSRVLVGGTVHPNATAINLPTDGLSGQFEIRSMPEDFVSEIAVEDDAVIDWSLTISGSSLFLNDTLDTVPWEGFAGQSYDQTLTAGEQTRANDNLVELGGYIEDLVIARSAELAGGAMQAAAPPGAAAASPRAESDLAWIENMIDYLLNTQDLGTLIDFYESWTP
ncbi:MAG: hypothetical protein AAGH83_00415 [Pseudomonadota bacterium]